MRASELIGSPVFDEAGRPAGVVRDLRVALGARGSGLPITGLVLSERGPLFAAAHAWGFAEGRASGPGWLRRMLAPMIERSVFVAADRVTDWGPARLTISGRRDELRRLSERADERE
jgi:hypothetical protein